MHGYNQGFLYLKDLCQHADIVFIQEHWLYPSNLHLLDKICTDFVCFSSSAVGELVDKGATIGRPFGGVAVLVRAKVATSCQLICASKRFIIVQYGDMLFVNVYMPCKSVRNYCEEYCDTLASITDRISHCHFSSLVCGGDFNYDFVKGGPVYEYVSQFMIRHDLSPTFTLMCGSPIPTYRHASLQAVSLIDHFLVSNNILKSVDGVTVLDEGCNLSDHLPVRMSLSLPCVESILSDRTKSSKTHMQRLRWDKADLSYYYNLSYQYLSDVIVPDWLLVGCDDDDDKEHAHLVISRFYCDIVAALSCAAQCSVPIAKQNFFKFWWDEQCQVLKDESINKHRVWIAAGRPKDGPVAQTMRKAKQEYKLHLKRMRVSEQSCFTNDLHDALSDKDFNSFWKMWNSKLNNRFGSKVINGANDHGCIADTFADIYAACAQPHRSHCCDKLHQQFQTRYNCYSGDKLDAAGAISVEMVDSVIRNMKRGRAPDPDGITAEHLLYSHPLLCVLLSALFRLMLVFTYVPNEFGLGLMVPLLKSDDCDSTVADNYRAITISPCISKAFESCLISIFSPWLESDILQFGFKKGRGCRDAIYTVKGVVNHINSNGSTAVLCALDGGPHKGL